VATSRQHAVRHPGFECRAKWTADNGIPGSHYCIKDIGHVDDITNDDHRCCCGATWDG
jgi:hypothetical protein